MAAKAYHGSAPGSYTLVTAPRAGGDQVSARSGRRVVETEIVNLLADMPPAAGAAFEPLLPRPDVLLALHVEAGAM